jgi:hypothetical protein
MRPASSFEGPQTTMSPDQVFSLANALALTAWLGLLFLPHIAAIRNVIAAAVIPCLFAAAYAVVLARFFDPGGFAKFSTLEGLASLQGSPWLLLAGWLHYLAFDLFVGAWEVRTARRDGIAHLAVVPSLILTFMVGPAGLLVFTVTRLLVRKRPGR